MWLAFRFGVQTKLHRTGNTIEIIVTTSLCSYHARQNAVKSAVVLHRCNKTAVRSLCATEHNASHTHTQHFIACRGQLLYLHTYINNATRVCVWVCVCACRLLLPSIFHTRPSSRTNKTNRLQSGMDRICAQAERNVCVCVCGAAVVFGWGPRAPVAVYCCHWHHRHSCALLANCCKVPKCHH